MLNPWADPDFLSDSEVLMRLWAHVSKEVGDGWDELHNVISPLSERDNTALQSSLGTAGLLEPANENLALKSLTRTLDTNTHTHTYSQLQGGCWHASTYGKLNSYG